MEITWRTIGQRCSGKTRQGKQCRLPASCIAGGLASCPYHINQNVRLFREVSGRAENEEYRDIFEKARQDSDYY